jgi:RHS repeat-associated protein
MGQPPNARITSGISNHVVGTDQAYTPYGELYNIFGSGSAEFETFAGLTGDFAPSTTTPVMWDTPNRELSMVGRWLSPDPAGVGWNQYAYPTNPHSFTDPSGLYAPSPGSINTNPINPYGNDVDFPQCSVDGIDEPCNMSGSDWGASAQCPNNYCAPGTLLLNGGPNDPPTFVQPQPVYNPPTTVVDGNGNIQYTTGGWGVAYVPVGPDATGGNNGPCTNFVMANCGAANNASPDPTLDNRANALAQALRKTGVQTLNSPCTIGGFYLGSAALGAGGAAVANAPEIVAVASENYPTWFNRFVSWLAGKASNPGPVGATGAALGAAYAVGKQFCGSF